MLAVEGCAMGKTAPVCTRITRRRNRPMLDRLVSRPHLFIGDREAREVRNFFERLGELSSRMAKVRAISRNISTRMIHVALLNVVSLLH